MAKYLLPLYDYYIMKNFRHITFAVVALVATLLGVGCSNDSDTVLTSQQSSIEKYLTGSHKPRLIVEDDVVNSVDEQPQFYTRWGMDIYRYIPTYYNEGRDLKPEITSRTTIEIVYTAYIFKSGSPTVADMYATNDAESLAKLQEAGLDTEYEWTTEPMKVAMGNDQLVEGLETALIGCREGDSVEIYLTYEAAYGNAYIGKVPSKSAVVWFIDILTVTE